MNYVLLYVTYVVSQQINIISDVQMLAFSVEYLMLNRNNIFRSMLLMPMFL